MKPKLFTFCLILSIYLANCSFQISLFKELNKEKINDNLIISPLSVFQILGLTANGAKGKTQDEMLLTLGVKDLEELNRINTDILKLSKQFSTVEIANAVMSKFRPKNNFLSTVDKYGASYETLKSADQVNSWCSAKTHGKINQIIKKLSPLIKIILINAVYFKGQWHRTFNKKFTEKKYFYNLNDHSKGKLVDRMSIYQDYPYYEDNELQMVELPYKKDDMSAVIILPNKNININNIISKLDDNKMQHLLKKMEFKKVNLALPKFQLDFEASLLNILSILGIKELFQDSADLSELKSGRDIKIQEVYHKTFLKVDEGGTEAAAVTGIVGIKISKPKKIIVYPMIIDRPFLFMIRNRKFPKNYELVFMAKIEKL